MSGEEEWIRELKEDPKFNKFIDKVCDGTTDDI